MDIKEFQLERYLARHEFSAQYLLCTSDCESLTIGELLNMEPGSIETMENFRLGYTESQGSPLLREEIGKLYESVQPDQIVVCSGAEEAIFISMHVLLRSGDHVIVQTPAYQSLHEVPRSIGCTISEWKMREYEGRWNIDPETLTECITSSTRALVINSPHNPTGHIFNMSEWRTIRDICNDNNIAIISDEVYRGSEHNPSAKLPPMADESETGYSIGVMSKSFGLAGLRIGWISSQDTGFIKKFLSIKDYTTICNSGPSEYLATVALRQKKQILQRNLGIIKDNIKILDNFFDRNKDLISWSRPVAGSTAFPRMAGEESSEVFCNHALQNSGILLLPGTVFGVNTPHFRMGYGRKDFPQVIRKFEQYMNENLKK